MKAMKLLIGVAFVASVGLNVWLWGQRAELLDATEAARAVATEAEALRAENEALKAQAATKPAGSEADTRELARLRGEVGQLRRQTAAADAQRRKEAQELAQLRSQLTTVNGDQRPMFGNRSVLRPESVRRTLREAPRRFRAKRRGEHGGAELYPCSAPNPCGEVFPSRIQGGAGM